MTEKERGREKIMEGKQMRERGREEEENYRGIQTYGVSKLILWIEVFIWNSFKCASQDRDWLFTTDHIFGKQVIPFNLKRNTSG